MRTTRRYLALLLLLAISVLPIVSAQTPRQADSGGRDPQPEDAIPSIIAAFDAFRVVAIGDFHGTKDLNDFVLSLVRHPEFPNVANDIVVEGTNSFLQYTLDRYIAGEDLPIAEVRQLWREGTLPDGVNDFQARLFQLVRRINQKLPSTKRLRVIAGEPPVDWRKITSKIYENRDEHIAAVIEKEVLAKNRKALMFYGASHVVHGVGEMAVQRYEQKYPGVTFVIIPYVGVVDGDRCGLPAMVNGTSYEERMKLWPAPSVVRTTGTWLADFRANSRQRPASVAARGVSVTPSDAYLYLGPPRLLLIEHPSVFTFLDADLLAEYNRRLVATGGNAPDYVHARIDPEKVGQLDSEALKCAPSP